MRYHLEVQKALLEKHMKMLFLHLISLSPRRWGLEKQKQPKWEDDTQKTHKSKKQQDVNEIS
jgi:hypothetical protein